MKIKSVLPSLTLLLCSLSLFANEQNPDASKKEEKKSSVTEQIKEKNINTCCPERTIELEPSSDPPVSAYLAGVTYNPDRHFEEEEKPPLLEDLSLSMNLILVKKQLRFRASKSF